MPLQPAITDLEQLKNHPAVAKLVAWNPAAVEGAKFDRDEMSIYVERSSIRDACVLLRDDPDCPFHYLADITCVDWFPSEPRFEVVYHLLSISKKERVRLKVRLNGSSPALDSVTLVWPAANYCGALRCNRAVAVHDVVWGLGGVHDTDTCPIHG